MISASIRIGPELNGELVTVSSARYISEFRIAVALPRLDGDQCSAFAKSIVESLRFRLGEIDGDF